MNAKILEKFDKQSGEILESTIEADPRVTKEAFAYEEYDVKRRCGTCNMYIFGRKCTLTQGDIDPTDGVCAFWGFRNTKPIKDKEYKPFLSKQDAGYIIEKGGTYCGSCKFMIMPNRCEMVGKKYDPNINPETGCCIAWTKKITNHSN